MNWPTPDQLKRPSIPSIPQFQGRRAFIKPLGDNPALHEFQEPRKRINDQALLQEWLKTEAYARIIDFLQSLNASVTNVKVSEASLMPRSPVILGVLKLLEELDLWITDIPIDTSSVSRFGNIAFRTWNKRLHEESRNLHNHFMTEGQDVSIMELSFYLMGGFGDGTRMDYGSGHELSFVAWLCCIDLLGILKSSDYCVLVLVVFAKYLDLVRKLQTVYNLEPAGSHGVWGLDDFQFLPYFFGSAQLLDHPKIKPKSITNPDIDSFFAKDYLYLACIDYINKNKKGPFFEHSPILYDISGVATWKKVNSGMLKMYIAEVLMKFPVVQHFVFGSLLPFDPIVEVEMPLDNHEIKICK